MTQMGSLQRLLRPTNVAVVGGSEAAYGGQPSGRGDS